MAKCKNCKNLKDTCFEHENTFDLEKYKPTNADRIRSMTDEELAEFLCLYDVCIICSHGGMTCNTMNCDEIGTTERWLKSEVEDK